VIQVRSSDKDLVKAARHLNDPDAHAEFDAERAFLKALGADARAPVGALAQNDGASIRLEGVVAEKDGARLFRDTETGEPKEAAEIGERLARRLLAEGGRSALAAAESN
jgi:hydroxymethylbilane synthase